MKNVLVFIAIGALGAVSACASTVTMRPTSTVVLAFPRDVLYGKSPCQFEILVDKQTIRLLPEESVFCPMPEGLLLPLE